MVTNLPPLPDWLGRTVDNAAAATAADTKAVLDASVVLVPGVLVATLSAVAPVLPALAMAAMSAARPTRALSSAVVALTAAPVRLGKLACSTALSSRKTSSPSLLLLSSSLSSLS